MVDVGEISTSRQKKKYWKAFWKLMQTLVIRCISANAWNDVFQIKKYTHKDYKEFCELNGMWRTSYSL